MNIQKINNENVNYKGILRIKNPTTIYNKKDLSTILKSDEVSINTKDIESIAKNADKSVVSIITKRNIYDFMNVNFEYLNAAYRAALERAEVIYDSAKKNVSMINNYYHERNKNGASDFIIREW